MLLRNVKHFVRKQKEYWISKRDSKVVRDIRCVHRCTCRGLCAGHAETQVTKKNPDSEEQNSGGNEISQLSRSHFRYLIRNIMSPSGWELFRPKKGPIFLTEDGKNKSCEMFPLILGGTFLLLFFQILCQIVSFDFSLVVRDPGHTPLCKSIHL